MERTTKHRILGILVVMGLVIILLPLFQGGKDVPTETVSMKAPPFPDQSVQVTANSTETEDSSESLNSTPVASDNAIRQDDIISATHPSIINAQEAPDITHSSPDTQAKTVNKAPLTDLAPTPTPENNGVQAQIITDVVKSNAPIKQNAVIAANKLDPTAQDNDGQSDKLVPSKKALQLAKHTRNPQVQVTTDHQSMDSDGLVKLTNAVWVIQLGSFKNKTNALRLVNQLRASGYRAFIQQVASNIRVYVGPEYKQASARALADKLESNLHIRGIVISYQPLTL